MFRIVEKKTGEVIYYESICNANKAVMVERASNWLARIVFKNKNADVEYCVEFAYFDWKNYWKQAYNRKGYSSYGKGWKCTTVVGLKYKEDGEHLAYGEHISGKKLDFNSKPKGGAWGAMMIDMGIA